METDTTVLLFFFLILDLKNSIEINNQKHVEAPEKFVPMTSFSFRGCPCPSVAQAAGLGALDRTGAAADEGGFS